MWAPSAVRVPNTNAFGIRLVATAPIEVQLQRPVPCNGRLRTVTKATRRPAVLSLARNMTGTSVLLSMLQLVKVSLYVSLLRWRLGSHLPLLGSRFWSAGPCVVAGFGAKAPARRPLLERRPLAFRHRLWIATFLVSKMRSAAGGPRLSPDGYGFRFLSTLLAFRFGQPPKPRSDKGSFPRTKSDTYTNPPELRDLSDVGSPPRCHCQHTFTRPCPTPKPQKPKKRPHE